MDKRTAGTNGATGAIPTAAPRLEITTSRQFVSWLAEAGGSLAFTTYQSGTMLRMARWRRGSNGRSAGLVRVAQPVARLR